ncbi:MAG: T9SS C-terminal target domain-containing protein [Flavobacteriia bacterium]|nr:T9SS C-terminal target domain-containing protein [Flavobacteriia bacterium]
MAFTPAATQTYIVTGTNANGCSNTAQVTVTVNALPNVSAGQNQTVCAGTAVTLNGSGANSYTWNNGVSNGVSFTPAVTQNYTVTGTDANGCANTAQVTVTVNALPTVSAGQNQEVCAGDSITLNGSGADTYQWDNNVQDGVSFTPAATQTYTVTGTNANGCSNTAQVTVTVNALPTVNAGEDTVVCDNDFPVTISANGNPNLSYAWSNGSNTQQTTITSAGTYTVAVTDGFGCSASDDIIVINEPCSGLEEGNFYFNLYPNPFDQFITLKSSESVSANIEIYSAEGRLISVTHMDGQEKTIALENLAKGSYTVRIGAANAQRIFTIIKQ